MATPIASSFPNAKVFNELMKKGKWVEMLWLRYDKSHRKQILAFLNTLTNEIRHSSRNWMQRRDVFDASRKKSLMDVVQRLFEIVDLVPSFFKDSRTSADVEPVVNGISTALKVFHEVLLLQQVDREFEAFRNHITTRLSDPAIQKVRSFPFYACCLIPSLHANVHSTFTEEAYSSLTSMFAKDEGTRTKFLSRRKFELKAMACFTEVTCQFLRRTGVLPRPLIDKVFDVISSVVSASRLETPYHPNYVTSAPIPAEIGPAVRDCFSRMFALCVEGGVFGKFQLVHACLLGALHVPEFWTSQEAKPLCCLLESVWNEIRSCEQKEGMDGSVVEVLCNMTRVLVHVFQREPQVLDVVESHLRVKRVIDLNTVSGRLVKLRHPALTCLITKTVILVLDRCPVSIGDPDCVTDIQGLIFTLLQNLMLIADSPVKNNFFADVMKLDFCKAVRRLHFWLLTSFSFATSGLSWKELDKDVRFQDSSYGTRFLACLLFGQQASLNVLRTAFQDATICRKYTFAYGVEVVRDLVGIIDGMSAVVRKVSQHILVCVRDRYEACFHPSLFQCEVRTCALSVLNAVLLELPTRAITLTTVMMTVLFEVVKDKDVSGEDAWLAVLALSRVVKNSPGNWTQLQAFRDRDGMRLSDLSPKCLEAMHRYPTPTILFPEWPSLAWSMEAMGVFQYMATGDDDDGNRSFHLSFHLSEKKDQLPPRRPMELLVALAGSTIAREGWFRDEGHTAGLALQLIGNYAANVAASTTDMAKSEDVREFCKLAKWVILRHLSFPDELLFSHLETTEMCFFALANLTAVPDPEWKSLLYPDVVQMAITLRGLVRLDQSSPDEKRNDTIDELGSLTAKAVINTNIAREGSFTQIASAASGLETWLDRSRKIHRDGGDITYYPELALRSLLSSVSSDDAQADLDTMVKYVKIIRRNLDFVVNET